MAWYSRSGMAFGDGGMSMCSCGGGASSSATRKSIVRPRIGMVALKFPNDADNWNRASSMSCNCLTDAVMGSRRTIHVTTSAHGGAVVVPSYSKKVAPSRSGPRSNGAMSEASPCLVSPVTGGEFCKNMFTIGLYPGSSGMGCLYSPSARVEFIWSKEASGGTKVIAAITSLALSYFLCNTCTSRGRCLPRKVCSDTAWAVRPTKWYHALSYVNPPNPIPPRSIASVWPVFITLKSFSTLLYL
mmetsp:Transcript_13859/g.33904  ORF Transcript_13859/g.33904 Transcript_13859/m.33904 type:complete len:243 (+) Transcript_13859:682-1410(+)